MVSAVVAHCSVISRATTANSMINGSQEYTSMTAIPTKKSKKTHSRARIIEPMASNMHVRGVKVVWKRTALPKITMKPMSKTTKPHAISKRAYPIDKICKTVKSKE